MNKYLQIKNYVLGLLMVLVSIMVLVPIIVLIPSVARADVNIVTTIKPLQLIAESVLQGHGSATAIMDPRQSPHHFTMSPSNRIALDQADLVIWMGPQFETYLSDFFNQPSMSKKTITLLETPDLLLHDISEGQLDAHLWLDSRNAVRIAKLIAERAIKRDPQNESLFRQNATRFETELNDQHVELQQRLSVQPMAQYAVYHNGYQYFEKQFGLAHSLVILRDSEVQPSIRELVNIRRQFQTQKPQCLLLEIDSSAELVNTVLNGQQIRSVSVDLLAAGVAPGPNGYKQFMSNLADDFISCLYDE